MYVPYVEEHGKTRPTRLNIIHDYTIGEMVMDDKLCLHQDIHLLEPILGHNQYVDEPNQRLQMKYIFMDRESIRYMLEVLSIWISIGYIFTLNGKCLAI
jgi:hypothetical protein